MIYDGGSRSEAARVGGVGLQIIRDWVLRFNGEGPEGLIDRKAPGPTPRLNAEHRTALAAAIESGPIPAIHGVVRWRLIDLCQWLWEEFRVRVARANAEVVNCAPWVTASSPPWPAPPCPSRGSNRAIRKKFPRRPGQDRAGQGCRCLPR